MVKQECEITFEFDDNDDAKDQPGGLFCKSLLSARRGGGGEGSVPRYLLLGTFSKETSSRDTWKISSSPYFWPYFFLFWMLYFLKGKFYAEITYTR